MSLKFTLITHSIARLVTLLTILLIASNAVAINIDDLQKQQLLTIDTWLSTQTASNKHSSTTVKDEKQLTAVVGEQIILNIQLGTNRWFTAGTKIPAVELPNVMSRQREQSAVNTTQRIKGETWYFQLWQISLLPQATGSYEVPALDLSIEVMSPKNGKVAGEVNSKAQLFTVILPETDLQGEHWFSASDVNIEQQWEQSNSSLHVGDSVTRTITTIANDSLSVLLPQTLQQAANEKFQAYSAPAQLQDTAQRGDYLATRTDQQTYILQYGGELVFPDVVVHWWDTKNNEMKEQVLSGQRVMVQHTLASWLDYYRTKLIITGLLIISLLLFILASIKHYKHHAKPRWWLYLMAINAKAWPQVISLLYQKIRHTNQQVTLSEGIDKQHQHRAIELQNGMSDPAQTNKLNAKLAFQLWFATSDKSGTRPPILNALMARLLPKALPLLSKEVNKWSDTTKK